MTTKIKTLTFKQLGDRILEKDPEDYNYFIENKKLIKISLELLNKIPDFYYFLEEKKFENYDLSTVFFEEIAYYIDYCYKNNKINEIKIILKYLDNLILEGDKEIIETISVGFLEFLRNHENTLQKTVDLMPKNLKELFMRNFNYK